MASIPNEPLNTAQIGVTSARSGGKLSPDVEPFTLILSERPDRTPVPPSAPPRSDNVQRTSTSDSDHSTSTIHNNDHRTDRVKTADDDSAEPDQPNAPESPVAGALEHSSEEDQDSEDSQAASQAAGTAALAASQKLQSNHKSSAGEELHSLATQNLAKKRSLLTPISGEKPTPQIHQYVDQETNELSQNAEADVKGAITAGVVKNIKRRAPVAERQPRVSGSGETKSKKSRKPTRDAAPVNADGQGSAADAGEDAQPEAVKTEAITKNDARASRTSKRSALSQTSPMPVDSGVTNKSDAAAQTTEPLNRSDSAKSDAPSKPAPQPTSPQASAASVPRMNDHLVPRSARKAGDTTNLNQADQNRFLQRVARAFDAAKNRDGEIRLRLSPPELGSLRLEVRMQQGGMIARLEAETPAARTLLIDNLPVLRERLAEQGVHIEQFDVDLLDRHDQSNFHDQGQRPSDDRGTAQRYESEPAQRASSEAVTRAERSETEISAIAKRINVII